MDADDWLTGQFEQHRPRLYRLCYRMLGSPAEADDALQDAWLRVSGAGPDDADNPGGWLTTVVSRVCLNRLRSRAARPEDPAGMHLPDPRQPRRAHPGRRGRSGQLGQPRAAGGAGYAGPCRAARVRAARHVRPALRADLGPDRPFPRRRPPAREPGPPAGTRRAATRYQCRSRRSAAGCPGVLRRRPERRPGNAVLDPDAVLRADGGASRPEVSALLRGSAEVARRAAMFTQPAVAIHPVLVNGAAGAVVTSDGEPVSVMAFTISGGRITEIDILLDPVRLRRLGLAGRLLPEAEAGLAVEQLAGDLQMAGVRRRLLDHVQDHHPDVGYLVIAVPAARRVGQADAGRIWSDRSHCARY